MERPYYSRSIISDDQGDLQITIPIKKNWLQLIISGFFLLVCTVFLLLTLWAFVYNLAKFKNPELIIIIPIAILTIAGILLFRILVSKWQGTETIVAQNGKLILKRNSIFKDPIEVYDSEKIEDFRVYDDADEIVWDKRQAFKPNTMMRFEYGYDTIKFAEDISYAEAEYLLDLIKEKLRL